MTLANGKLALNRDLIELEMSNAVLFVQQTLALSSIDEVWRMGIIDFCKLMRQANSLHEARSKKARNGPN